MPSTVLVTGGDGFVGQHLIELLIASGHDVIGTTAADSPAAGTLGPEARAAVRWVSLDVRDSGSVRRLLDESRPRRIFHLAGFSSSSESRAMAAEALRVNAEGTLNVLEGVARADLHDARIIVTGSADAYGRGSETPITEATLLQPESAYGVSKAAQDVVARGTARALGLDVRVARLFPLIGPGQREAFVLPSFCRRALAIARGRAEPVLRVGNLGTTRDFTDVRDGVRALVALAEVAPTATGAYNVCSGEGTSVDRLLAWVLEVARVDPEIVADPALVRVGEPERIIGDPASIAAATGWRVERDLQSGVRDTFFWLADLRAYE